MQVSSFAPIRPMAAPLVARSGLDFATSQDAFESGRASSDPRLGWLRAGLPVAPELVGSSELKQICGEQWPEIEGAYRFAKKAHADQQRDDGTPYYHHPARVLKYLVQDFKITDVNVLKAALLHDVVEDTPTTEADIGKRFGATTASMVGYLSKPERLKGESYPERNQRYLNRLLHEAPAGTLAVKLADRWDNIDDLHLCPERKMIARYLQETREHYLPLTEERFPALAGGFRERLDRVERWFQQT